MRLAGVDAAWKPEKNGTAIAIGRLSGSDLDVEAIYGAVFGSLVVAETILAAEPSGIAIDAPLIIENKTGQRPCEKALSKAYASKHAGCHSSNQSLLTDAATVALSKQLQAAGYKHLGQPHVEKFQIEVYPHPALIEIFNLAVRLPYKKRGVALKRAGQIQLAGMLRALDASPILRLKIPNDLGDCLDPLRIATLQGRALKENEDLLDSLVCLYVAGLYAVGAKRRVFGDADSGYIVVPLGCVV